MSGSWQIYVVCRLSIISCLYASSVSYANSGPSDRTYSWHQIVSIASVATSVMAKRLSLSSKKDWKVPSSFHTVGKNAETTSSVFLLRSTFSIQLTNNWTTCPLDAQCTKPLLLIRSATGGFNKALGGGVILGSAGRLKAGPLGNAPAPPSAEIPVPFVELVAAVPTVPAFAGNGGTLLFPVPVGPFKPSAVDVAPEADFSTGAFGKLSGGMNQVMTQL